MKRLVYSPKAAGDLDEIYDYTEANWGFQQAEDYVLEIRACCEAVSTGAKFGLLAARIKHGYFLIRSGAHFIV
ncbi:MULTISPECIES: type II toxin-antitoxin system RelE/ParE family toxin [Rhizobium]|uniref:Type II toxin-antitoxin system RelE/ParE family toxin n=1 Tax=Rhizobium rhododendri TaxID=2506430 RepID=A0ABY8IGF3_9HYPH|nr:MULTISPECIES: type II toxin-antitoxin system RelE/ParE family toxin [Rhizobium]MBZ5760816.1 type II toxin-antitoxin system RelE/ParE family toxin [Rhizobium sp. VS19-DR96]MBZ5765400.1 type II toxin-antitoxin system RelE/ParE family toxin [Rhizobium sp. VS19-DR129.2]MBZ5774637.1 type II toxin-antitoxin system RelE/ParE family toxin [Rhizobium sp. VS19-DRK62.2]MBZ5784651.1 type II toxin-antitoxin system RelE/ParE family toxin [Rhizobium sp. VS19-DR121]MBZ5801263.1 type II toxin-antitoxin syst